jgi:hypothetical protein
MECGKVSAFTEMAQQHHHRHSLQSHSLISGFSKKDITATQNGTEIQEGCLFD